MPPYNCVMSNSDLAADVTTVRRMAAFTRSGSGGNPAGIVVTDTALPAQRMLEIAAAVGDSETVFAVPRNAAATSFDVRYFAPRMEVTFCGHATVALAVALAEEHGPGTFRLYTASGVVPVAVQRDGDGYAATLTSVPPRVERPDAVWLGAVLATLGWLRSDLDQAFTPALAYAGAWHLVLMAVSRDRLRRIDYAFTPLRRLMEVHDLATVAVLTTAGRGHFHARNLFPTGGVVEDPATGAAAAAFGAYLRHDGHIATPAEFTITQGEDMGRPSLLTVSVDGDDPRVRVSGTAAPIPSVQVGAPAASG